MTFEIKLSCFALGGMSSWVAIFVVYFFSWLIVIRAISSIWLYIVWSHARVDIKFAIFLDVGAGVNFLLYNVHILGLIILLLETNLALVNDTVIRKYDIFFYFLRGHKIVQIWDWNLNFKSIKSFEILWDLTWYKFLTSILDQ